MCLTTYVSTRYLMTLCLLATIPGNQIIDDNRNLPIFRLDSVVVNWENQPVKTLCRKPASFCCHKTFGCIVQWNFWLREREGTQSLVPRPNVLRAPCDLIEKYGTQSLVLSLVPRPGSCVEEGCGNETTSFPDQMFCVASSKYMV